jgi:hypothetical protein
LLELLQNIKTKYNIEGEITYSELIKRGSFRDVITFYLYNKYDSMLEDETKEYTFVYFDFMDTEDPMYIKNLYQNYKRIMPETFGAILLEDRNDKFYGFNRDYKKVYLKDI